MRPNVNLVELSRKKAGQDETLLLPPKFIGISMFISTGTTKKHENPFQNYDLAKKLLEAQKKFFCIKIF